MADLRPIGTEFELVEPPDQASNDTRWVRARYRVVAHDNGGKLERLECIRYERITPPEVTTESLLSVILGAAFDKLPLAGVR